MSYEEEDTCGPEVDHLRVRVCVHLSSFVFICVCAQGVRSNYVVCVCVHTLLRMWRIHTYTHTHTQHTYIHTYMHGSIRTLTHP